MNKPLLFASVGLAALLSLGAGAQASSLDDNKVVRDSRGNVILSQVHRTCVRTMWEAGQNPCGPQYAAGQTVLAQQPQMRTVLSSTDRVLYFGFDSATLTADSRRKLDAVATTLRQAQDVRAAAIIGYADRKGSPSYNVDLSQRRAEAVRDYLAQRGYLNTEVAAVRALGESVSVTACDRDLPRDEEIACLGPDRRVELDVKYVETKPVATAPQPLLIHHHR